MSISYTLNTPVSGNDPSVDQPNMTNNTNAVSAIWAIDHNTFNTSSSAPSGTHLQATFYANQSPTLGSALGILFPVAGLSSSATNISLINANGTFPMSLLKACGSFVDNLTSGNLITNTYVNCTQAYTFSANRYNITINPSTAISGTNPLIFVLDSNGNGHFYSYTSPTLKIAPNTDSPGSTVNFFILQV